MVINNSELNIYLSDLLGDDLQNFLSAPAEAKSIRLNTLKIKSVKESAILNAHPGQLKRLSYSKVGYSVINALPPFSQTIDFFNGLFTFQGASSQIPPIVLNPVAGDKVLDMAASPGSKTSQIAALMNNEGSLIVNDSNINRMQALNTNTQRLGMINHCVYYLAGERLGRIFPEYFDKVLLDAPCTGLGTLATNKEILKWWSLEKLKKLAALQKQLLISAIKATKVGGEIVYSTCSVAPEENELLLNDILEAYPVEILSIDNIGLGFLDPGLIHYKGQKLNPALKKTRRVWPQKHGMEGFFITKLKKTAEYFNKNSLQKTEHVETYSSDNPVVREALQNITVNWGIDNSVWSNFRYVKTRKRLWLFNASIDRYIKTGFTNGGLMLAEKRMNLWRLTHQSVQFFKEKITQRRLELKPERIRELFLNGSCTTPIKENGYFVVDFHKKPAAVVYIEDYKVRIKLSQPFNV